MSDEKVVTLFPKSRMTAIPRKPEQVWQCGCGNQTFWLNNDDSAECAACCQMSTLRHFDPQDPPPKGA